LTAGRPLNPWSQNPDGDDRQRSTDLVARARVRAGGDCLFDPVRANWGGPDRLETLAG